MTPAPPTLDRRVSLAVLLPALVVGVVGAGLSGAVVAYAVGDPGAVMRWSVIVTRILRDVGAAMTIGFALVGAFLAPETTRTHRRATASRLAAASGTLWLVGLLGSVVADFADVSGLTPNQPRFWSQFFGLSWELGLTRMGIISAFLVGIIVVICSAPRGRTGLAWSVMLGWLALLPQALAGHASVSRDHMSSINALAIHLIAATTWVGGLGAVAAMRHTVCRAPDIRHDEAPDQVVRGLVRCRTGAARGGPPSAAGGSGGRGRAACRRAAGRGGAH